MEDSTNLVRHVADFADTFIWYIIAIRETLYPLLTNIGYKLVRIDGK